MSYVELHCHSNFSLLDGASRPEDLVARAAKLGMPALALTDHDAVYGAVRFVKAAKAYGVRPILGAEMTLADGHHLTLLVENDTGWRNLCTLISIGRHHAAKGESLLPLLALADHNAGLIALSGCSQGEIAAALARGDHDTAICAARRYRELFGPDRFYIELQRHFLPDDQALTRKLLALARLLELETVATNNVHYAEREAHCLQDVLVCIRHQLTLDEAAHLRRANAEYSLKPANLMAALFQSAPKAIENTVKIAERCQFELAYGLQDLPTFPTPTGEPALQYLNRICGQRVRAIYPGTPTAVWTRLYHELGVIERCGLANYFLIVWDIVRFARSEGILCQGRGSAANSLVAYLLGISPIDPLAHDLVFERFLSDERKIVPDIDIDFQADRREEVIQYAYNRYGVDHAAMASTLVTFRARSAVRDVSKALGLPLDVIDDLAGSLDRYRSESEVGTNGTQQFFESRLGHAIHAQLFELCQQIEGFPRHLGIHNGGMVITGTPIADRVPTEPATMPGRVVVQWDKDSLEEVGLIKIDILGLRMLSAIAESVRHVEATTGQPLALDQLTYDDPRIFAMIEEADTIGVFQVESRAQAQNLPRLKPRTFEDIIISISLIRPGPIQGNLVHPYMRRRMGEEPVRYDHALLETPLRETLGVILFQEQILKVARDLAGFSPGQGEQLRRALGSKRAREAIDEMEDTFIAGAGMKGVDELTARKVFTQLRAFSGYSFPKSHAAAFAVLVYRSAWLRYHYPAAFYVSLLNHQPMGFWTPAVLVNDARRRGIDILPVDVHISAGRCTLEASAIRLGFSYVDGFGDVACDKIERARRARPFQGLSDFWKRTGLARRLVENLILAGALDTWGVSRRKLLWDLGMLSSDPGELALDYASEPVPLPEPSRAEALSIECEVLGLSIGDHPTALYRAWLSKHHVLTSADLHAYSDQQHVQVAGLIVVHQSPPTAKGFHFVTLEDEFGLMNIVVRPAIYSRFRRIISGQPMLLVDGHLEMREGVINVVAEVVRPLTSA